jgi:hypothetical protein
MGFQSFSVAVLIVSLIVLGLGASVLSRKPWIRGWLRGNAGIAILLLSGAVTVFAFNMFHYQSHETGRPLTSVSIERLANGQFRLTITDEVGDQLYKDVGGDLWYITYRMVTWGSLPTSLGMPPGYRMERLTTLLRGTLTTGDATARGDVVTDLSLMEPELLFDSWPVLDRLSSFLPSVRADRHESGLVPLVDGAVFTVHQASNGLLVRPVNDMAEVALQAVSAAPASP